MRIALILIICLLFLTGCSSKDSVESAKASDETTSVTTSNDSLTILDLFPTLNALDNLNEVRLTISGGENPTNLVDTFLIEGSSASADFLEELKSLKCHEIENNNLIIPGCSYYSYKLIGKYNKVELELSLLDNNKIIKDNKAYSIDFEISIKNETRAKAFQSSDIGVYQDEANKAIPWEDSLNEFLFIEVDNPMLDPVGYLKTDFVTLELYSDRLFKFEDSYYKLLGYKSFEPFIKDCA